MQGYWYTLTLVIGFRNISQFNGGISLGDKTWIMKGSHSDAGDATRLGISTRTSLSIKTRIGEKLEGKFP